MSDLTYPATRASGLPHIAATQTKPAGKVAVFWCGLLLLSLSYELPLYEMTSYDRLNPRLFDVVLVLAAVFSGWRLRIKDAFVGSWLAVTLSFVLVGGLSFLFLLPDDYRFFSLFYAIKYIEIMLFLLIISGFDWSREQIVTLLKCFVAGVAFAGAWGILQKLGILPTERCLPSGELINVAQGAILSTYGPTYFHAGIMGAMGATAALALRMENRLSWLWFAPLFTLSVFLAVFAGSRAGLALFLFAACLVLFRRSLYVVLGVFVVSLVLLLPGVIDYLVGESITVQRIMDTEHANSVEGRISLGTLGQLVRLIDYHGAGIFLHGGGFYAVPMPDLTGLVRYRVGYGIHNIHLFPFEQAGILGFLACMSFWVVALNKAWRARRGSLGASGLSLLAGIAVIGWAGQIFFLGFGTENMLAAQLGVIYLLIAAGQLASKDAARDERQPGLPAAGPPMPAPHPSLQAGPSPSTTEVPEKEAETPTSRDEDSPLSRFLAR